MAPKTPATPGEPPSADDSLNSPVMASEAPPPAPAPAPDAPPASGPPPDRPTDASSDADRIAKLEATVKGQAEMIEQLTAGIQVLAAAKAAPAAAPAAPLPTVEEALETANARNRPQQSRDGWVAPVPPKPSPIVARG